MGRESASVGTFTEGQLVCSGDLVEYPADDMCLDTLPRLDARGRDVGQNCRQVVVDVVDGHHGEGMRVVADDELLQGCLVHLTFERRSGDEGSAGVCRGEAMAVTPQGCLLEVVGVVFA